jgi:4-aminobutyrate aminotransferase
MKKPSSQEVVQRHNTSMAPAVGHYQEISFDWGEGSYLYDFEGKRYIDLVVGIATCSVGHCHPEVVEKVREQAGRLMHTSSIGYYRENVEYAELIKQVGPASMRDGKVLFVNSGSEAIEAGLKMARMVTRRPTVIAFMGGFHGRPMGALAATASDSAYRKGITGLMVGVQHAVYPNCYRCPLGHKSEKTCNLACADLVRQMIKHTVPAEDLAGIIMEPMAGESGYIVPPSAFVREMRKICDETGACLIMDEIQTGFARTGKMFACEHHGVEPDILVFAKAVGGGLPLGGILARKELADKWVVGSHGSTFGGNPVSCVCGKKSLEIILRDKLTERAAVMGKFIMDKFNAAKKDVPAIGDVRGLGLMVGVELVTKDGSPDNALMKKVLAEAGRRGVVLVKAGDSVLRICPALNIPKEAAEEGINILIQTIKDMSKA